MTVLIPQHVAIVVAPEDKQPREEILRHLKPLQMQGVIEIWESQEITIGSDRGLEVRRAAGRCDIAVVVITANLQASEFIQEEQVKPLLGRYSMSEVVIIPVFWSPALSGPFAKIHGIGSSEKPLAEMKPSVRDAEYVKLCEMCRLKSFPSQSAAALSETRPELSGKGGISLGDRELGNRSRTSSAAALERVGVKPCANTFWIKVCSKVAAKWMVLVVLALLFLWALGRHYVTESVEGLVARLSHSDYRGSREALWELQSRPRVVKERFLQKLIDHSLDFSQWRSSGEGIAKALGGVSQVARRNLATTALKGLNTSENLDGRGVNIGAKSAIYGLLLRLSPGDVRIEDALIQLSKNDPSIQLGFESLLAEVLKNPARGGNDTFQVLEGAVSDCTSLSVLAGLSTGLARLQDDLPQDAISDAAAAIAAQYRVLDPTVGNLNGLASVLSPWSGTKSEEEISRIFSEVIAEAYKAERLAFAVNRIELFIFSLKVSRLLGKEHLDWAAGFAASLDDVAVDRLVRDSGFLFDREIQVPLQLRITISRALVARLARRFEEDDVFVIPQIIRRLDVELGEEQGRIIAGFLVAKLVSSRVPIAAWQVEILNHYSQFIDRAGRVAISDRLFSQVTEGSEVDLNSVAALRAWSPQLSPSQVRELRDALRSSFRKVAGMPDAIWALRILSSASVFLHEDDVSDLFDVLRQEARDSHQLAGESVPIDSCVVEILDAASQVERGAPAGARYMLLAQAEFVLRQQGFTSESLAIVEEAIVEFGKNLDTAQKASIKKCLLMTTQFARNPDELGLGLAAILALSRGYSDSEFAELILNFLKYPEVGPELEIYLMAAIQSHSRSLADLAGMNSLEIATVLAERYQVADVEMPPVSLRELAEAARAR